MTLANYDEKGKSKDCQNFTEKEKLSAKFHQKWLQIWNWTGFAEKKGWDFLSLIIVPLVLGYASWQLSQSAKEREMAQAHQKERQEALVKYIDDVPELIYKQPSTRISGTGNHESSSQSIEPTPISLLQAKTRTTLQLLEGDTKRRDILIIFLRDSDLLHQLNSNQAQLRISKELHGNLFKNICLKKVNLSETELTQANLANAKLDGAILRATNLNSADLSNAVLSGADLRSKDIDIIPKLGQFWNRTILRKEIIADYRDMTQVTTLFKANLKGAYLNGAKLNGAILALTNLREATLDYIELSETDLRGTNLINTDLSRVNSAELKKANLEYALYDSRTTFPDGFEPENHQMIEVKKEISIPSRLKLNAMAIAKKDRLFINLLQGADLSGTILTRSDFKGFNLEKTNLTKATLTGVILDNTILTDADLSDAIGLEQEQLDKAKLCRTNLPDYIKGINKDKDCPLIVAKNNN